MQSGSHKDTSSPLMISTEDPAAEGVKQHPNDAIADDANDEYDEHDANTSSKQRRLLQSCDSCRRKKIKCDSTKPSCFQCTHLKLTCNYSPLLRKKRSRRGVVNKLEERIHSMELILQPLLDRMHPATVQSQASLPVVHQGAQIQQPGNAHTQFNQGFRLPEPQVVEEMMELVATRITPLAPLMSYTQQLEMFRAGRLPEFIVCGIVAVAARFSMRSEFMCLPKYNAGRAFAERSAELISGLVDRPNPYVVQGLLMLSFYEWGCGRGESSWTYVGMAIRLAQRCRLHLVDEEDFNENASSSSRSWVDTEWQRRLWWYIYCCDQVSKVVASRPAMLHNDDIVVNLPSHDHNWIMGTIPDENKVPAHINMEETWVPNQFSTCIPDCWWMVIEMYRIGGRIAEFANRRRRPVRPSDPSRRTAFDALDTELEAIRGRFVPYLEFPPRTEWLLSGYANLGDGANGMTHICAIYFNLHVMYYGAKIILHRSELPSYAYEKISPEMIQRAKSVCIEAAHKQADVIRWALESVPVEYWDPRIGIWTQQGASIHVNAALCDDNTVAEQSRRDLEVHLKMHAAADEFYHFNKAIITMLHHIFNLRKQQRLLATNKASGLGKDADAELLIEHENDPDPWIVPRCSSYLGFTYTYTKLHGFLNDAIKQTTFSPPDLKMTESGHYRTLEQGSLRSNGLAVSMTNALVSDPPEQQRQQQRLQQGGAGVRKMSVDSVLHPARPHLFESNSSTFKSAQEIDLAGNLRGAQPGMSALGNMTIPADDINTLLNSLVSGTGSAVTGTQQQPTLPEPLFPDIRCQDTLSAVATSSATQQSTDKMSNGELQEMIMKMISSPQQYATHTSVKQDAIVYADALLPTKDTGESSTGRHQDLEKSISDMRFLLDGI